MDIKEQIAFEAKQNLQFLDVYTDVKIGILKIRVRKLNIGEYLELLFLVNSIYFANKVDDIKIIASDVLYLATGRSYSILPIKHKLKVLKEALDINKQFMDKIIDVDVDKKKISAKMNDYEIRRKIRWVVKTVGACAQRFGWTRHETFSHYPAEISTILEYANFESNRQKLDTAIMQCNPAEYANRMQELQDEDYYIISNERDDEALNNLKAQMGSKKEKRG